jgi:hypothetical protein
MQIITIFIKYSIKLIIHSNEPLVMQYIFRAFWKELILSLQLSEKKVEKIVNIDDSIKKRM